MIKYSVIIPIYNAEKYLEECVNSIINQKRLDVEIILVNDGSKDRSQQICEHYEKSYKNVKLINKINSGTTDTIQKGIENVCGKYICFVDSDDCIVNDYFSILDEYIDQDYDVIMFNYVKMYKNKKIIMKVNELTYGEILGKELINLKKTFPINFNRYSFYRWDKVIKTNVIKESIKNIKEKPTYLEDHVFSFLNLLNSNKIIYIDNCLYEYRVRMNSVSRSINEKIFDDYTKVKKEMFRIFDEFELDINTKYYLQLYFLYQYSRYSLKSIGIYRDEMVSCSDIKKTKDKDKKIVLFLYKYNLKIIYRIILKLKEIKEKSKGLILFD